MNEHFDSWCEHNNIEGIAKHELTDILNDIVNNPLNGKLQEKAVKQLKRIFKENPELNDNNFGKGSGVNYQIIKRIRNNEDTKITTLDQIGEYIVDREY